MAINVYIKYPTPGGGSGGDVVGPGSSTDGGIALFDGTTGLLLKEASGTGVVHATSGVYSVGNVTNAELDSGIDATKLADGSVTNTELQYINTLSGNAQTQLDGKLALAGGTMTGTLTLNADPASALQAATKQYVDNTAQGLSVKSPADVATTANITLSGEQTIDGVLTSASRVLVKNQSAPAENGIYTSAAGAWSRTTDADTWAELVQAYVFVTAGSSQAFSGWLSDAQSGGTIGVTSFTFNQFSQAGTVTTDEEGITITGSQISLVLDGTTLSKSGSGLKVATGGITNTEVDAAAAIDFSKLATLTSANILVGSAGNVAASVAMSGDIGISNAGVTAIQSGVIVNADINASAAIDFSKLAALTSANILVGSAGNVATAVAMSGDIGITNAGVTAIQSGVIVNADVNASAAIDFSKLATLTSGNILVGSAGNVATSVAMSGEATIIASGAVTLANSAVIGKVLTGYTSGAGTVASTDTILQAVQKLNGNDLLKQPLATLTTKGDIYVATGSATVVRQGVGTNGQFLKANSAVTNGIEWAAGTSNQAIVFKSADYTATAADDVIQYTAVAANRTLTLFTAVGNTGKVITVIRSPVTFSTILTVLPNGSETIDGNAQATLRTQNETLQLISDGANWLTMSRTIPSVWVAYTPTFTGFGTATAIEFWWKRVGDSIQIKGKFTAGTLTSTEARISLPSGLTLDSAKEHSGGGPNASGSVQTNKTPATTVFGFYTVQEGGNAYLQMSRISSTLNGYTAYDADDLFSNSDIISIQPTTMPIAGFGGY